MTERSFLRTHLRTIVASAAALVIVLPLAWMWWDSRLPGSYSVMDMGYVDLGGGPDTMGLASGHDMSGMAGMVAVPDLVADPDRPADVTVDLTATQGRVRLASGREVEGYLFNGTSPGPLIEATEGDLVEVHVTNEDVGDGISVHWHGVDVPNAEDGVAGVTQDAIGSGEDHTYRFVVDDPGTYWYHSHQVSHTQVLRGLYGPLVVHPEVPTDAVDVLAVTHTYAGTRTLNGDEGVVEAAEDVADGQVARVRIENTDNGAVQAWSGAPYRVLAVDGRDVNEPTEVTGLRVSVPAGGRYDLEVTAPARIHIGSTSLVVGGSDPGAAPQPREALDLLSYGAPAPLPFDATQPDRTFRYSIGRRPGFLDGRPGMWWSINGHLYPDIPMYVVDEGDVVVFDIENHSGEVHPMHLHGHHAVVLSRDGVAATGSPWWVDSVDVADGETMRIAFVADNPGVWMDHCHNLKHAAQGLVAHLMYSNVTDPYVLGDDTGNTPE